MPFSICPHRRFPVQRRMGRPELQAAAGVAEGEPIERAGRSISQGFWSILGVSPSNPSLRGKGVAGRCEAAGPEKPEAYSLLEYVEDFFGPRTTQMLADRLPQENGITRTDS
jgi:hypothetical protein